MSPENVRERKQKRRYTFIVVPDAKSQTTRTLSISRLALIAAISSSFIVIVALVCAVIIYTPLGTHLPISNPELVRQYGKQIVDIQKDLSALVQQITVLKNYNLKLRRAMGEDVTKPDSVRTRAGGADSSMMMPSSVDLHHAGIQGLSSGMLSASSDRSIGFAGANAEQTDDLFSREIPFIMPAEGLVSRVFQPDQFHFGIDVAGNLGSTVVAAADGNIVFSGWTYDDGFTIMIAHDEGFLTVYKHCQSLVKNTGETVRRGEVIALLGNTGKKSTGPHVHFEVWKNGIAQDPNNFLLNVQ